MANYIRAASLGGFELHVRSYGINPISILKEVGILPSLLRDPDSFIDYELYLKLLEKAAVYSQDECFGLKLGALQNISTIGLIGVYMSRQTNILDALHVAQKYLYLHAEGVAIQVTQDHDQCCKISIIQISEHNLDITHKSQLAISLIMNILKDLIGPQWYAEKVHLKQKLPPTATQQTFKTHLKCSIEFEKEEDALYFPATFLINKPDNFNEDWVNRLIEQQLKHQGEHISQNSLGLIENTIKMLLATGDSSIENTALCLGMHPKRLQRLLKTQGTNYRNLLEQVRKKEALRLLDATQANLTDIALQLGYAELSIFSRNFKKWFGFSATTRKEKPDVILPNL